MTKRSLPNLTSFAVQGELVWDKKTAIQVLTFVNKACDNHALAMLALCYLPGVIAAYIQVLIVIKVIRIDNRDRWL